MEDEYVAALQNSTYKKEDDKERKLQARQCLDELEEGGKILARNLTPRSNLGRLKLYWEPTIAKVVSQNKSDVTCEIKFKSYPNKTRVLHCNMLMSVTHLLDTIDTVPIISILSKYTFILTTFIS